MQKFRTFFDRQSVVPFETLFGFYCMYGGIVGTLSYGNNNDLFRRTLGDRFSFILNVAYFLAGSGMFFGIGLNRKDVESVGLITVASSLLIRTIVMSAKLGLSPSMINANILTMAFIVACLVRCIKLLRGNILIEITDTANKTIVRHE